MLLRGRFFTPLFNWQSKCKKKRIEACSNNARAYWAFMQGLSESLFYLFA